jgi:hypothetical protein
LFFHRIHQAARVQAHWFSTPSPPKGEMTASMARTLRHVNAPVTDTVANDLRLISDQASLN